MTEIVWDATGDKHLLPFILVLPVNFFTAVQMAGSRWSPTPLGCDSGEPKLHLPSATGSASRAPAAGQVSLAMWRVEVGMLQLPPKMGKSSRSLSRFGVQLIF